MPPTWVQALLDSDLFIQAGIAGATMVFVIVLLSVVIGLGMRYINARDAEWRSFLTSTHKSFMGYIDSLMTAERDARAQAMQHGLSDVRELTEAVRQQAAAINTLASGIGQHDRSAVMRHGQIMTTLGEMKTRIDDVNGHVAQLELIRQAERERREKELEAELATQKEHRARGAA